MIFKTLDRSLGSISSVHVWRYKLVSKSILFATLFQIMRCFVVHDIDFGGIAMTIEFIE